MTRAQVAVFAILAVGPLVSGCGDFSRSSPTAAAEPTRHSVFGPAVKLRRLFKCFHRYAHGPMVRYRVAMVLTGVALVLTACAPSFGSSSKPTPRPTASPTHVVSTPPVAHKTPVPSRPTHRHIALMPDYRAFIGEICQAIAAHNATPLINNLEYYQYNSGVYYATFNRSEGQTAPAGPQILTTWLSSGSEHCVQFAPSFGGHAVLATAGWTFDGGWCILDLDKMSGVWKIDDFTFGGKGQVLYALSSNNPEVIPYNGHG